MATRTKMLLLLCFALLGGMGDARAEPAEGPPAPGAAERFYQEGLTLYRQGRYGEAIGKFQSSFDLRPASRVLLDIGHAHLKMKNGRDALFFFNYYLRDAMRIPPTVRADVERNIEEARALLAQPGELPSTATPQAAPALARPLGPAPKQSAPPVPAMVPVRFVPRDGRTRYEFNAAGRPYQTPATLDLQPGRQHILVTAPTRFESYLYIPPGGAQVRLQHLTNGRIAAGVISTSLGVGLLGFGLALYFSPAFDSQQREVRVAVGTPLTVTGVAGIIAGLVSLASVKRNGAAVVPLGADRASPP